MKRRFAPSSGQIDSYEGLTKRALRFPATRQPHKNCAKIAQDPCPVADVQFAQKKNSYLMEFVSVLYGTKVENMKLVEMTDDISENAGDVTLSEDMLNLTICNSRADDLKSELCEQNDNWMSAKLENDIPMYNLVEYPLNVVSYGKKFKQLNFETDITCGSDIKIQIFELIAPFRFWFITDEMNSRFTAILEEMEQFYNRLKETDLQMAHTHIFPHQICAVPFVVGWGRGIIQSYLMGSKVTVFLVDFGMEITLPPQAIKYLKHDFMDLHQLALRGDLAYIRPKSQASLSSSRKRFLYNLMCFKTCKAKIVEIKNVAGNKVLHLEVYRRNSEPNISQLLVDKGLAEYKEKYAGRMNEE